VRHHAPAFCPQPDEDEFVIEQDPRTIAYEVLDRVQNGAFADLALDGALESLPGLDIRDRALVTELVYGVLRYRGRLDFALQQLCSKPLAKVEPAVLSLLRLGCYQLLQLDRIPAHAAVFETVELARRLNLQRATGFINGILRALVRQASQLTWPEREEDPLAYLEHVLSLPHWLAKQWLDDFGVEEACAMAEAMLHPAPCFVRTNTLKIQRDALLETLAGCECEAEVTRFAPEGIRINQGVVRHLSGHAEGLFQMQDEASMLISHLLDPQPGDRILDACAAPGGKTTHMSALTDNQAQIVALDLHPQRVELITRGAVRLGCLGIEGRAWDLTRTPKFLEPESFDRILVDAPCSGLGVLRRNPEIRWRRKPGDLKEMARLQRTILHNVAPLLRSGGRLIYSLCTFSTEETEDVIQAFLSEHPEFVRCDLRDQVPDAWRELFDSAGALRTLPQRHGGMDAFFAVAFQKRP
jgi:16S rRNA (cytosine967-C5)-methyltransferase